MSNLNFHHIHKNLKFSIRISSDKRDNLNIFLYIKKKNIENKLTLSLKFSLITPISNLIFWMLKIH